MTTFNPAGDVNQQLQRMLNEGLTFDDNFVCSFVEFTTTALEQEIRHELGHVPNGYLILDKDGATHIWSTRRVDWTTEKLFLLSDVANVTVRLIVL